MPKGVFRYILIYTQYNGLILTTLRMWVALKGGLWNYKMWKMFMTLKSVWDNTFNSWFIFEVIADGRFLLDRMHVHALSMAFSWLVVHCSHLGLWVHSLIVPRIYFFFARTMHVCGCDLIFCEFMFIFKLTWICVISNFSVWMYIRYLYLNIWLHELYQMNCLVLEKMCL